MTANPFRSKDSPDFIPGHPTMFEAEEHRPAEPARARTEDPETSHLAAVAASKVTGRYQVWVLHAFRLASMLDGEFARGLIDHDLYRAAGDAGIRFTEQGLRTARVGLYRKGLIEKTGQVRKTPYGQDAETYRLTQAGRDVELPPHGLDTVTD